MYIYMHVLDRGGVVTAILTAGGLCWTLEATQREKTSIVMNTHREKI